MTLTTHCLIRSGSLAIYECSSRLTRFLWLAQQPDKLSEEAAQICRHIENTLLLSVASLWEIQIKAQLGKLDLLIPLEDMLNEQMQVNRIALLTIQPHHVFALGRLPIHHNDPFDRLLIAQAVSQSLPIVSRDSVFSNYPVQLIW
jgi:PIN domain nuclease of toxin-antitoxin system